MLCVIIKAVACCEATGQTLLIAKLGITRVADTTNLERAR